LVTPETSGAAVTSDATATPVVSNHVGSGPYDLTEDRLANSIFRQWLAILTLSCQTSRMGESFLQTGRAFVFVQSQREPATSSCRSTTSEGSTTSSTLMIARYPRHLGHNGPVDAIAFRKPSGASQFGVWLTYAIQSVPNGPARAFHILSTSGYSRGAGAWRQHILYGPTPGSRRGRFREIDGEAERHGQKVGVHEEIAWRRGSSATTSCGGAESLCSTTAMARTCSTSSNGWKERHESRATN
jgi:hypothetical protein